MAICIIIVSHFIVQSTEEENLDKSPVGRAVFIECNQAYVLRTPFHQFFSFD